VRFGVAASAMGKRTLELDWVEVREDFFFWATSSSILHHVQRRGSRPDAMHGTHHGCKHALRYEKLGNNMLGILLHIAVRHLLAVS
jgi:hypothetical protein